MTCVVWSSMTGVTEKVTDKKLRELLYELRQLSGEAWELEEFEVSKRRLFRKPVIEKRYSLYFPVCGGIEWQIINHVGNSDWSINHGVSKAQVGSLMVGYRMGFSDARRSAKQSTSGEAGEAAKHEQGGK